MALLLPAVPEASQAALADAAWGIEGGGDGEGQPEPKQALAVLSVLQETDDHESAPVLLPAADGRLDALATLRWVYRWPGSPAMGRGPVAGLGHAEGQPDLSVLPEEIVRASESEAQWLAGYRAAGGPPWLETRMLAVTLHCEGSRWAGYHGSPYWTRSQFEEGTWATINAAIGPLDPDSPYDTARATAWWLWAIGPENAGTTAGWPTCFWIETGE